MIPVPRRVLYVFANAHLGGAENITMLMLRNHNRSHYDPQALFLQHGPLVDEAQRLGVTTHCLPWPLRLRQPIATGRAVAATARIIATEEIDLVHSCMGYAHLIAGSAARFRGVPAVWFQHGPVGGLIDRAASLVPTRLVLANSAYTQAKQAAVQLLPWPQQVISLATDLHVETVHASDQSLVITMLSRLAPGKGLDFAIEALAPMLRDHPTMRLVIVGGAFRHFFPHYQATLQDLATQHQISDQVEFTGFQRDIRPYLASSHILLSASFEEAFGLTLIEGMAGGQVVVASQVGGAAEVLEDGVDGLYYPAGDGAALRRCISRLLDDAGLRARLIQGGQHTVEARYRPRIMMQALERCYDDLLAGDQDESMAAPPSDN